jgi:hypothetical protein
MGSRLSKTVQPADPTWAQHVRDPQAARQEESSRQEAARQEAARQEDARRKADTRRKVADHRKALEQKDLKELADRQKALQQEERPLVASCQQDARQEDLQEEPRLVASFQQTPQEQKERRQKDIFQEGVQLLAGFFRKAHPSEEALLKEAMAKEDRRRKDHNQEKTEQIELFIQSLNQENSIPDRRAALKKAVRKEQERRTSFKGYDIEKEEIENDIRDRIEFDIEGSILRDELEHPYLQAVYDIKILIIVVQNLLEQLENGTDPFNRTPEFWEVVDDLSIISEACQNECRRLNIVRDFIDGLTHHLIKEAISSLTLRLIKPVCPRKDSNHFDDDFDDESE